MDLENSAFTKNVLITSNDEHVLQIILRSKLLASKGSEIWMPWSLKRDGNVIKYLKWNFYEPQKIWKRERCISQFITRVTSVTSLCSNKIFVDLTFYTEFICRKLVVSTGFSSSTVKGKYPANLKFHHFAFVF